SITTRPPSAGTAEQTAASTAAVPEPVNSTAANSSPPSASRTSRSRQSRITSKNSGSRWQRSGVTSASRTSRLVLAGPGLSRIHSRSFTSLDPFEVTAELPVGHDLVERLLLETRGVQVVVYDPIAARPPPPPPPPP